MKQTLEKVTGMYGDIVGNERSLTYAHFVYNLNGQDYPTKSAEDQNGKQCLLLNVLPVTPYEQEYVNWFTAPFYTPAWTAMILAGDEYVKTLSTLPELAGFYQEVASWESFEHNTQFKWCPKTLDEYFAFSNELYKTATSQFKELLKHQNVDLSLLDAYYIILSGIRHTSPVDHMVMDVAYYAKTKRDYSVLKQEVEIFTDVFKSSWEDLSTQALQLIR